MGRLGSQTRTRVNQDLDGPACQAGTGPRLHAPHLGAAGNRTWINLSTLRHQFHRNRELMKTVTRLLLAASAATVLGTVGTVSAQAPSFDDIVAEPSAYDALRSNKAHEMRLLSLLHERLLHVRSGGTKDELVPGAAERWQMATDGKSWTFYLRHTATPDGLVLTPADVVFSVNLHADPKFNSPRRPSLIVAGQAIGAEVAGPNSVRFTTTVPSPFLPWMLQNVLLLPEQTFAPYAKNLDTWVAACGKNADLAVLRGFGPYQVTTRTAQKIILSVNPKHYAAPPMKEIRLQLSDDPAIQSARFLADPTIPYRVISPADRSAYADARTFTVAPLGPDESTMFFWLNQNPKARNIDPELLHIFQNIHFRYALAHAVDREEVIELAFLGEATPLFGPISDAFSWARPQGIDLRHATPQEKRADLAAQELSKVAGLTWDATRRSWTYRNSKGKQVPVAFTIFTTPSPGDIRKIAADALARQFSKIGLQVRAEVRPFNVVVSHIDDTFDYDACLMFLENMGHPSAMRGVFHSSSGMHFFHPYQEKATGWEATVDKLFDRYVQEVTPKEQECCLAEVLRLWTENQPVLYLATQNKVLVTRNSFQITGRADSGKTGNPVLDRPFIDSVRITPMNH